MQSKLMVPLIIGALVIGGGSFYGGMHYATSKANVAQAATRGARGSFGGGFGGGQGRNGAGGFTTGAVVSKDATSLTVQMRDGSSKIVFYSTSTRVGKMTDGTIDDIAQGTNVMVSGTANQDGSVMASNIQIRPAGQEMK